MDRSTSPFLINYSLPSSVRWSIILWSFVVRLLAWPFLAGDCRVFCILDIAYWWFWAPCVICILILVALMDELDKLAFPL